MLVHYIEPVVCHPERSEGSERLILGNDNNRDAVLIIQDCPAPAVSETIMANKLS